MSYPRPPANHELFDDVDDIDPDTVQAVFQYLGQGNTSEELIRRTIERAREIRHQQELEECEGQHRGAGVGSPYDLHEGSEDDGDGGFEDAPEETFFVSGDRYSEQRAPQDEAREVKAANPRTTNAKASIETAGSSGNLKSEQATRRSPLESVAAKMPVHGGGSNTTPQQPTLRRDPLNTGEKVYPHQRHYDGYLHLVRKIGEENISIPMPTERSKPAGGTLSARSPTSSNVDPGRVAGLLRSSHTPATSSVIYGAMSAPRNRGQATPKQHCSGAATAGGRRANDPVSRGQMMRQQWQKDPFLTQKGRKEERWQVRQSMLGWRVDE